MTRSPDRQRDIYRSEAARYDALVSAEDCDGNLTPALAGLVPLAGARVADVGTGTGRLARLLRGAGARVTAVDREPTMLAVARRHLAGQNGPPAHLAAAAVEALPLRGGAFDLACAGWVFGHFPFWSPDSWRDRAGTALGEMTRILRPGGTLAVLETLGTAVREPAPPNCSLAEYYRWLEEEHGLVRHTLRTDYAFASIADAVSMCKFFFGPACAKRVQDDNLLRVKEFTGLWSRIVP